MWRLYAIILLSSAVHFVWGKVEIKRTFNPSNWKDDPLFLATFNPGCDIPIVNGGNLLDMNFYPHVPILFRNLTSHWLAHDLWKKGKLIDFYGNRMIRSGSDSSIVYSAGHAEKGSKLGFYLQTMNDSDSQQGFIFDTTILSSIPELASHFDIPPLFQDWDSLEKEQQHEMWHFLSLGPSRVGLQFHNHGKTWIAVVHGRKYWYLYPPGYGPPREVDRMFSALDSAHDWLTNYYAKVLAWTNEKPPLANSEVLPSLEEAEEAAYKGFRPLECMQHPGDVLFLPSMWSHMTMNIGETIAIGGQQYLGEGERFDIAWESYYRLGRGASYETIKDLALGNFFLAARQTDELKGNMLNNGLNSSRLEPNIVLEQLGEVVNLAEGSMDSMAVVFHAPDDPFVTTLLQELRNVSASLDVVTLPWVTSTELSMEDLQFMSDDQRCVDNASSRSYSLPLLVLYPGLSRDSYDTVLKELKQEGVYQDGLEGYVWSPSQCVVYESTRWIEWPSLVEAWMTENNLIRGSLTNITVYLQLAASMSLTLLEEAMAIRPLHPELLFFFSDIGSRTKEWDTILEILMKAEKAYDAYSILLQVPRFTLASLYHKLAAAYEQFDALATALRLLGKSSSFDPTFLPAIRDHIRLLVRLNRLEEAKQLIDQFRDRLQSNNDVSVDYMRDAVNDLISLVQS
eukprot:gene1562-1707_t